MAANGGNMAVPDNDGFVPVSTWPFCQDCHDGTVDFSPRSSRQYAACGPEYHGRRAPCAACGSVERGRWIELAGIPVLPTGRYRMIYTELGILTESAFSRFVPGRGRDATLLVLFFWLVVAALLVGVAVRALSIDDLSNGLFEIAVAAVVLGLTVRGARTYRRRRRLVAQHRDDVGRRS